MKKSWKNIRNKRGNNRWNKKGLVIDLIYLASIWAVFFLSQFIIPEAYDLFIVQTRIIQVTGVIVLLGCLIGVLIRNYVEDEELGVDLNELILDIRQENHEIKNLLNQYLEESELKSISQFFVVNRYLNGIDKDCMKYNIEFEYVERIDSLHGFLHIESFLLTLMTNLVDNGIEAIKSLEVSIKKVYVQLEVNRGGLYLEVTNYPATLTLEAFEESKGLGVSTKHKSDRGIGLYMVSQLVEKYQGEFIFRGDLDKTSLCIMIRDLSQIIAIKS